MYNWESARRGEGDAAPPPPPAAPAFPITASGGGGGVAEAYKKENESLKDMIAVLTKEHGSNGILEGKYLAQIKKCKALTVQLESEKSHARQLQKDLDSALAKVKASEAHATQADTHTRKRGKSSPQSACDPPTDGLEGTTAADGDSTAPSASTEIKSLRERLDRSFQQVRAKDIAMEELKRENAQLRYLVRQEVGDLDNKEVDALLRRAVSSADNAAGLTAAGGGGSGGAWKGRAEQIALLKAKVKSLERDLATTQSALQYAAAAAGAGAPDHIRDDGTSSAAFLGTNNALGEASFDQSDAASWLSLAQRTRGGGVAGAGGTAGAVSVAAAEGRMVSSGGVKDYDEAERQHLADMSNQKLLRVRELEQQLEAASHQLEDGKRKQTALQARYQTLQRQQAQLRAHVETMLDKSATDDELIAAYKEEIGAALQEKRALESELIQLREDAWQQEGGGTTAKGSVGAGAPRQAAVSTESSSEKVTTPPRRGSADQETSGSHDVNQLRQLLRLHKAEAQALREELVQAKAAATANTVVSAYTADAQATSSPLLRALTAWWAQAISSPSVVAALRRARAVSEPDDASCAASGSVSAEEGLMSAVMAVLLVAHKHVLAAESRQAALVDTPATALLDVLEHYESLVHNLHNTLTTLRSAPSAAAASLTTERLDRLIEVLKGVPGANTAATAAHTNHAVTSAELAKKENAHLRERTRVLTELLEKERQALVVAHREELKRLIAKPEAAEERLHAQTAAPGDRSAHSGDAEAGTGGAGESEAEAKYAALQRQYNDLRKAFNQMQSQLMKDSA